MPNAKPEYDVAVALLARQGLWLIARRHDHAHLGGLWEFPGGKCEDGEDATDAAVRELLEECGVVAQARRTLPTIEFEYEDRIVHITPVVCTWISGEAQPLGSAECRWVTVSELTALEMPAVNAEIVRELIEAS